jgi:NADH:ubiquinone oxidoreductase subunit B-like Fe-S oxidoreductase
LSRQQAPQVHDDPTSRSLARLRRAGYLAAVVEKWVPGANVRSDLWRFGDVLAAHPARRDFLIVQATSASNVAARLTRAMPQPELGLWLLAGGRFEIWGVGVPRWALGDGPFAWTK